MKTVLTKKETRELTRYFKAQVAVGNYTGARIYRSLVAEGLDVLDGPDRRIKVQHVQTLMRKKKLRNTRSRVTTPHYGVIPKTVRVKTSKPTKFEVFALLESAGLPREQAFDIASQVQS